MLLEQNVRAVAQRRHDEQQVWHLRHDLDVTLCSSVSGLLVKSIGRSSNANCAKPVGFAMHSIELALNVQDLETKEAKSQPSVPRNVTSSTECFAIRVAKLAEVPVRLAFPTRLRDKSTEECAGFCRHSLLSRQEVDCAKFSHVPKFAFCGTDSPILHISFVLRNDHVLILSLETNVCCQAAVIHPATICSSQNVEVASFPPGSIPTSCYKSNTKKRT